MCYAMRECVLGSFEDLQKEEEEEGVNVGR